MNEFQVSILQLGVKGELPEQLAENYTVDQLAQCAELIEAGLLKGKAIENGIGQVCCIIHPKITLQGRNAILSYVTKEKETPKKHTSETWDVFISHASEDKESFVRDLANALTKKGLRVWYDESTLTLGDSLRRSIDQGLSCSRFGIVILSHNFFSKEWSQKELDGLVAKENIAGKVILPIWHNIDKNDVIKYSPMLADRMAVSSSKGLKYVVDEVLKATNWNAGDNSNMLASSTNVKDANHKSSSLNQNPDIPMPKIKGKITQRDRDKFIQESFSCIRDYFMKGLSLLEQQGAGIEGDIQEINTGKFIAKIYVHGERKSQCKIWIGGTFREDSIAYSESNIDMSNDNSMNDWLESVEVDGQLLLKVSGMCFHYQDGNKALSKEKGAEYLWKRFIEHLER